MCLRKHFLTVFCFILPLLLVLATTGATSTANANGNGNVNGNVIDDGDDSDWIKVPVPGAVCGDGGDYKIFVRKGSSQRVAFGFSGGGACWSYGSCFGAFSTTNLKPVEKFSKDVAIFSTNGGISALSDHTQIWFPYCTGDVYLGNHVARYRKKTARHLGLPLVQKTLAHIKARGVVKFEELKEAVVYGFSAGAIGAITHLPTFDQYLEQGTQKVLIADSPGMHFGNRVWRKFGPEYLADFQRAFEKIGIPFSPKNGNVAQYFGNYCKRYSGWQIGVLQSTRDFVMSVVFGNISMGAHARLVTGPKGILHATRDPSDNCSAWVPKTQTHTFIHKADTAEVEADGITALRYANEVIGGIAGRNYPEPKFRGGF
jgi:hypothetical protein